MKHATYAQTCTCLLSALDFHNLKSVGWPHQCFCKGNVSFNATKQPWICTLKSSSFWK